MQRRMSFVGTLWAMLVAQVAIFAQEPATPKNAEVEATDVRPSDDFKGPMGVDASRKALTENFLAWGRQMEVKARINEEQKKNFTGTPEEALRIHLMEIVASEDQAAMGNAITGAAENYRHQCGRALSVTFQDLKRDLAMLEGKKREINDMLMTVDSSEDVAGRELAEDELNWAKRRLRTLINHRNDVAAAIEVDKANASFYRDELLALVKLDRYLDGWAADLSAHVERVVDAAERESKRLLLKDVKADQQQIRQFAAIFYARVGNDQKIVPPNRDDVEQRDGIGKLIPEEPPLTPEEEEMVEAELEKFRQSREAKMP